MAYLVGIDIGTSSTKTVFFDHLGVPVVSATREYPLYQPRNGWAEQEPSDWWNATCETLKECIAKSGIDPADIDGVGLSGQMHGLVMLDEKGEVLCRSIIWCDQRTAAECVEITEKVGAKRLIEITANPALTGFTASKILWMRNNHPEIYAKCRKILLPKDYIRYMLTGEFAAEVSDASGMQLLDVPGRKWSDEVLKALGIDKELLAPVYESPVITGCISRSAHALCGLREGTPVAGGAGDNAAGAIGNGIVENGLAFSTIGTSGVVFVHTDSPAIDPMGRVHTFCHAVPGAWHVMGVTQAAGLSLKWFRDNFCQGEIETARWMNLDPYVLLDREAELVPPGANGLIYLPYLMGERTPHLDPDARGVFFGLSGSHTKRDMLRAVMEGVIFSLNDCVGIIREMGISVGEIRASGGGGRSRLWKQMQAEMFGCPVLTNASTDAPSLGVALLAGVGTGVYLSVREACSIAVKVKESCEGGAEAGRIYKEYYGLYRQLYRSLKADFSELSRLINRG